MENVKAYLENSDLTSTPFPDYLDDKQYAKPPIQISSVAIPQQPSEVRYMHRLKQSTIELWLRPFIFAELLPFKC